MVSGFNEARLIDIVSQPPENTHSMATADPNLSLAVDICDRKLGKWTRDTQNVTHHVHKIWILIYITFPPSNRITRLFPKT